MIFQLIYFLNFHAQLLGGINNARFIIEQVAILAL